MSDPSRQVRKSKDWEILQKGNTIFYREQKEFLKEGLDTATKVGITRMAWVYKPIKIKKEGIDHQSPKERLLRVNRETFGEHLDEYRRWLWIGIKNYGEMTGSQGSPLGMCGLCALTQLKEIGVMSLKIVGREATLKKKVASVKLIKEMLDFIEAGHSPEEVRLQAKSIKGVKGLCESGYMCYYR